MTVIFQMLLNAIFTPLLRFLPLKPLSLASDGDEENAPEERKTWMQSLNRWWKLSPISITKSMQESIHSFVGMQYKRANSISTQSGLKESSIPTIWMPKDRFGLSDRIIETRSTNENIRLTNQGSTVDKEGKVEVERDVLPP